MSTNGWKLIFISAILVSVMISCDKDEDDSLFDNNNSKMLDLMNSMMSNMDNLTMTNDPDNDFAMMMREHHNGAINMGNHVIKEGNNTALHQIAREMIAKQQKEIVSLDSFLVVHAKADDDPTFHMMAQEAMDKMMNNAELQNLKGDTDHDYAILMIQHHQGAIDMSELQIHYGHSDGLKRLAGKMKKDQQKEIIRLQGWLLE